MSWVIIWRMSHSFSARQNIEEYDELFETEYFGMFDCESHVDKIKPLKNVGMFEKINN